jgi:hypothetical protein
MAAGYVGSMALAAGVAKKKKKKRVIGGGNGWRWPMAAAAKLVRRIIS